VWDFDDKVQILIELSHLFGREKKKDFLLNVRLEQVIYTGGESLVNTGTVYLLLSKL
jgi:hypothetical protein